MTNDFKAGKLSIVKCNCCRDGYMIAKPSKDGGYFLGCTNYKPSGKGCNNKISKLQFYMNHHYAMDSEFNDKKVAIEKRSKENIYSTVKRQKIINSNINIKETIDLGQNLNDIIITILNALLHLSEINYYGITTLVDILRGSQRTKLKDSYFYQLPEFGKLNRMSHDDLVIIIEWLIENKFILKTKHPRYPVLHPTYEGIHYNDFITEKLLNQLHKRLIK